VCSSCAFRFHKILSLRVYIHILQCTVTNHLLAQNIKRNGSVVSAVPAGQVSIFTHTDIIIQHNIMILLSQMGRSAAQPPAAAVQRRRRRFRPAPAVRLPPTPADDLDGGHDEVRHSQPAVAFVGPVAVADTDRLPERWRRRWRLRRLRRLLRLHGRLRRRCRHRRLRIAGGAGRRGGARRGATARGEEGQDQGRDRSASATDRGQRPAARGAAAPGPDPGERRTRVFVFHAAVAIRCRYIIRNQNR